MLTPGAHNPARLLAGLDDARRDSIVLAVSGGSDSTALLTLAIDHVTQAALQVRLVAVTVDHRLRPESRAEAEAVGRLCKARGIEHRIFAWDGPKPATGIAAAAREARYGLLARAAREMGTDIVLTGHTADDQDETVAMRRRRGDGPGLAGMADAVLVDGDVWVIRPLITWRRATLRTMLDARGIGWIDDPSNEDGRAERVRVRNALADGKLTIPHPATEDMAARRRRLSRQAAQLIAVHTTMPEPGIVRIGRRALDATDDSVRYAWRVLLASVGGTEHLPSAAAVDQLLARLRDAPARATLGRCVIASRRDAVWLARETRGLPAPAFVPEGAIWDGRYRVVAASGAGFAAGAWIEAGGESAQASADSATPAMIRHAAAATRPIQTSASGEPFCDVGDVPHALRPVVAPYGRFLPAFDLDVASAAAHLIGAPSFPDLPWRGHIGAKP